MKKVLFFIESLAGGGAEKVLSEIVAHLDHNQFDITVYTVTDGGVYDASVRAACKYHSFLRISNYRRGGLQKILFWLQTKIIYHAPARLVYLWKIRGKYDIEVAFVEGFATKLIANSRNRASKKITWLHIDCRQCSHADRHFQNLEAQRKIYQRFDQIFCVSEYVSLSFQEKFGTGYPTYIQYNPVDEEKIKAMARESIALPDKGKGILLCMIGRLEPVKGYLRMMACVRQLRAEGYSFTIWILGTGSQKQELTELIEKDHLGDTVKLLGFHDNPYPYLNACDGFLCTSFAEGFSTAATESLILHKPIFTVRCAGMDELFGNEICGKIVENTDEALLHMMRELVSGQIKLQNYEAALQRRAAFFRMEARIREIERQLNG